MFSAAPAGSYPLVPSRDTKSPLQLTPPCHPQYLPLAQGQVLRPTGRPVRQRSGLVATEEWLGKATGVYPVTTGTDPETRAGWNNILHRSWWTAVYARRGSRMRSVQPCVDSTRQTWRLLDGFLPLQQRANASALPKSETIAICSQAFELYRPLGRPTRRSSERREDAVTDCPCPRQRSPPSTGSRSPIVDHATKFQGQIVKKGRHGSLQAFRCPRIVRLHHRLQIAHARTCHVAQECRHRRSQSHRDARNAGGPCPVLQLRPSRLKPSTACLHERSSSSPFSVRPQLSRMCLSDLPSSSQLSQSPAALDMCTTLLTPTRSVFRTVSTPASRISSMLLCGSTSLATHADLAVRLHAQHLARRRLR